MKVLYKSFAYKCVSVLRFILVRIFYIRKLSASKLSMIGSRCGFYIPGNGRVKCLGRIIINDDVMIFSKGTLVIGDYFGINSYSRIVAHERIVIGNNVTIGQMVTILDHDHAYSMQNENLQLQGYNTSPIEIGDNVWIGDKCTILKGVKIGDNVVIGADTLVKSDVPSGSVVAGNPLKVIRKL